MRLNLISLRLTNFKGVRDFTLDANGSDVTIYGDNEAGKTTLFDALCYLLFDKDGRNKKDFEIKTLDENNQPLPGLNHEVEGTFDMNGSLLTLRKVYAEKWTKKRGTAKSVFSGHTVDHFIDGVPVKKGDFDAKIATLIPEDIFKLLTSPLYFNEQLHWTERRKILLRVCGDVSDDDVFASSNELAELKSIVQKGRTLDEHKAVIASRRKEIDKELDKIPVRIDEATRALPDITGIDRVKLPVDIANLKHRKQQKEQDLARIESGGEVAERKRQLAEVEGEILQMVNEHKSQGMKLAGEMQAKLLAANGYYAKYKAIIDDTKRRMTSLEEESERIKESVVALRNKWYEVSDRMFEFDQDTVCPTCGQDLPEESLADAREKAKAAFNLQMANELESITTSGRELKDRLEVASKEHNVLFGTLEETKGLIAENEAEVKSIQAGIDALMNNEQPISDNPKYAQKLRRKSNIEEIITKMQSGIKASAENVRNEIADFGLAIEKLEEDAAKIKRHKDGQKRIKELEARERLLAAEFEKLEKEVYLTEQFTRAKVRMVNEKINKKFKYARFKMFEQQVNGGLTDCCETLYKGVPYNSNLNAGHKIIVGMDIIRTLSDYFDFIAPIFVDNAESVTKLPEMDAQVIRLVKPEITDENRQKYSKLVVEIDAGDKNKYGEAV